MGDRPKALTPKDVRAICDEIGPELAREFPDLARFTRGELVQWTPMKGEGVPAVVKVLRDKGGRRVRIELPLRLRDKEDDGRRSVYRERLSKLETT